MHGISVWGEALPSIQPLTRDAASNNGESRASRKNDENVVALLPFAPNAERPRETAPPGGAAATATPVANARKVDRNSIRRLFKSRPAIAGRTRGTLLLFLSTLVPVPIGTPIPCVICEMTVAGSSATFSGSVVSHGITTVQIQNPATKRSIVFVVPANFRGVDSADGVIKVATLARVTPGLQARVSYTSAGGVYTASRVLLLTIAQCRSLEASERADDAKIGCPD